MGTSAIVLLMVVANGFGATTPKTVVEKQNRVFEQFWGTDFVWKFDDLPTTGTVPNFRVPYSGYIYPDRGGGLRTCCASTTSRSTAAVPWRSGSSSGTRRPSRSRPLAKARLA